MQYKVNIQQLQVQQVLLKNKFAEDATKTQVIFRPAPATSTTKGGNGLSLQIGDTADDYNRITVSYSRLPR